ncbi:uncharacterized protein LOC126669938 [Mercurialis annua]|uniref:uncharacterized protein LOC126669938 n=1 Tax=Mercurialis annua TaxID=3986 RepID=UPI00215E2F45|nr:uncharacterized protein LOC126669938 [Mercurialis annua]
MEDNSSIDLHAIRRGLRELEEQIQTNFYEDTDSHSDLLLKDSALQIESKVQQIINDCSDFSFLGIDDLNVFMSQLKDELVATEAETSKICNEIEALARNQVEDYNRLEGDIELLKSSLDFISAEDMETDGQHACREDLSSAHTTEDYGFEILKLDDEIEKSKIVLKSLHESDSIFKMVDAVEQIEEAFSGLKVIEFDGSYIRLSLQTYLPKFEDLMCQHKIEDAEPSEVIHEFLIEVVSESMELRNVEMFPNDIYIADIIDAAKSFRQLISDSAILETRFSLAWFLRTVQDRIIQCTLRRLVVKSANKSRHSLEYLDRDETIVAHLVGGIDAFIKLCQGWPISRSPVKLITLKSLDHHTKEISLSFLCRVEEAVNSLDIDMRLNLVSFVEAIEKLLVEQMRKELQSDLHSVGPSKV